MRTIFKSFIHNISIKEILLSFLLLIPILFYYLAYFYHHSADLGFGFLSGDMPSYMANARQHFDENGFHFFYANPFNLDNKEPHIYFQIHTLLLGVFWKITGISPGILFMIFGFVCAFFAIWLSLKLFKSYLGWGKTAHLITFIIFIYGGGLLIFSGFMYSFVQGAGFQQSVLNCKMFDPGGGFWMLNYGRNFIFPTEAYYHLLSIGILFFIHQKKQLLASLILFLLAASHPFYGIQFLIIVLGWQTIEILKFKKTNILLKHLLINLIILSLFVFYYGFYLNKFPEHRIIVEQWSLNWILKIKNILPAYGILILIIIIQIRTKEMLFKFYNNSFRRFLVIYAIVSFLLANHELFIKPIQPIHFTHGHIFIPLFLLAAEPIFGFFQYQRSKMFLGLKILLFFIFIFDNLIWFTGQSYVNFNSITKEEMTSLRNQEEVINYLKITFDSNYLLTSENKNLEYYTTVYSSLNALVPHPANTPFVAERIKQKNKLLYNNGLDILSKYHLIVVDDITLDGINLKIKNNNKFLELFRNKQFIVYQRKNLQ